MRIVLPPKLLGASQNVTFDFTSSLAVGETITSQSVTASVFSGTDPSPSSILSGVATSAGSVVTQLVTGGVAGTVYELLCTANTSASQTLQLSAYLAVIPDLA
jgi:hypothetical protein